MFIVNTYKPLFPFKKKEIIYYVLKTWLRISLGEGYATAKSFRKITNYWFIQKFGTMTLENELGIMNDACFDMEEDLSNLRAEYKTSVTNIYNDKHRLYYLLTLTNKEDISSEEQYTKTIPELEFEEVPFNEASSTTKDSVHITCSGYSPKRKNPKEIQLVNKFNIVLHDLTAEKASIAQSQLTRKKTQNLPKVKEGLTPKEPEKKNILGYTNSLLSYFIKFCIIAGYISEGIILQNIFHHNIGLSSTKSYLATLSILGVTFIFSRLFFNKVERLVRTIKKQWIAIAISSILFFTQLAFSGALTYYNIQREVQTELLQKDKESLAIKEGSLEDFDVEEDLEEITQIESEIAELNKEIEDRSTHLKTIPFLAKNIGYLLVGLTSIIVLFCTILLKALGEVYSHVSKLKKNIKKNEARKNQIEEEYPVAVAKLQTAYDTRHHFVYYLAKKHVLELLLAQEDKLNTEEFYRKYNLND